MANRMFNWANAHKAIYNKYKSNDCTNSKAALFKTSLEAHASNKGENKSIVLFPGRWPDFDIHGAFKLAQSILSSSKFSVYVIVQAHPLTVPETAHELNPYLSGFGCSGVVAEGFVFETPIALGRLVFDDIVFNCENNLRKLLLLKIKPQEKCFPEAMLKNFTLIKHRSYVLPDVNRTASEINESFVLASAPASTPPHFLQSAPSDFDDRKLHHPLNLCKDYAVRYLYSAETRLTRKTVCEHTNLDLSLISDLAMITSTCNPGNLLRIIKLGKISCFKELEDRGLPLVILQQLEIASQIFAISNFYFKIELKSGVNDTQLAQVLHDYNEAARGPVSLLLQWNLNYSDSGNTWRESQESFNA